MADTQIPAVMAKRTSKMSPVQSRFWFAEQYMNDPTQSNMAVIYNASDEFEVSRFQAALAQVLPRHESLQTAYFMDPTTGELLQAVRSEPLPFFAYIQEADEKMYMAELEKARQKVWELGRGELVPTAERVEPRVSGEAALESQYHAIDSGALERELAYWMKTLTPLPETTPLLPFARVKARVATKDFGSHTTTTTIDPTCTERVKALSRSLRGSPFHFHLSVVQILLCRLLGIEEVCIGTTDAGRSDYRFANTVGFFVNTLPLRLSLHETDTFSDVFRRAAATSVSALSNSAVPFELITEHLGVPRSSTHTPLFQVMVNYRMGEVLNLPMGQTTLRYEDAIQARSPYDMTINITPSRSGPWMLEVVCRNYLYTPDSIQQLSAAYSFLLESLCDDHSLPVQQLPLFPQNALDRALQLGDGGIVHHGWPETLVERFDTVAEDHAIAVAVTDASGSHTYRDLSTAVGNIAAALVVGGIRIGGRIGVICEPSMGAVAAMLAVLRVGAVYVPLDIRLPMERQLSIIADCNPAALVCQLGTMEMANSLAARDTWLVNIDDLGHIRDPIPSNKGSAHSLAFILYSSGSTGRPKGIMLHQAMFTHWIPAQARIFSHRPETVLQQSSLGFDMAIAQMFLALGFGGNLVIVPQDLRFDPIGISRLMVAERVSLTFGTPAEYTMLLGSGAEYLTLLRSWRYVYVGGELVTDRLIQDFHQRLGSHCPGITIAYGPTEAGGVVCTRPLSGTEQSIMEGNLGKVFPNTSLYVVDKGLNLLPPGFPGEVCIGGAGVGLGYLDSQMAKGKFIDNPFASADYRARGWTRLYKTGDQGKLLEDGSLFFMGRMSGDTVIKLRGIRVDLEEGAARYLVAHVVFFPGNPLSNDELQDLAATIPLPQSIRPSFIIPIEAIPTTPNGKVDRKALAGLPIPHAEGKATNGRSLTLAEAEMKMFWEQVLPESAPTAGIAPDSDFFAVGGTSLLLAKLQGVIRQSSAIAIPLADLFKASTLDKMTAMLSNRKAECAVEVIDWEHETRVSDDFLQSQGSQVKSGCRPPVVQQVLLTGSTSFLGSAILTALLQTPSITQVHCIAVQHEHRPLLPFSDRVTVYSGQLMEPALGLSHENLAALHPEVDLVIHAGTFGNCMNSYSSLRIPNFHATRFLAAFALRSHIPFHYISSNRVTLLSGKTSYPPISVSGFHPPTDGSEGFVAAKWASEQFLESVVAQTPLAAVIHRPCYVIGDGAPSTDTVNAVIQYSRKLSAVPALEGMDGYFDFKQVGEVANGIVDVAIASGSKAGKLSFRHHSSGIRVPVGNLSAYLVELYGGRYDKVPTREWIEKATEAGMEGIVGKFMESIIETGEDRSFPFLESS
ncbi:acetyl-CoA synthetase-like protein [Aspergillus karnatakaensis]|uniref:acetyl-CoA synthetase-like protein n=1 Tax=Aspergillus karnatakaensis TaxID=1810916 RepID=UPI003CCDBA78